MLSCSARGVDLLPVVVCAYGGWLAGAEGFAVQLVSRLAGREGLPRSVGLGQFWQRVSIALRRWNARLILRGVRARGCMGGSHAESVVMKVSVASLRGLTAPDGEDDCCTFLPLQHLQGVRVVAASMMCTCNRLTHSLAGFLFEGRDSPRLFLGLVWPLGAALGGLGLRLPAGPVWAPWACFLACPWGSRLCSGLGWEAHAAWWSACASYCCPGGARLGSWAPSGKPWGVLPGSTTNPAMSLGAMAALVVAFWGSWGVFCDCWIKCLVTIYDCHSSV